MPLTALLRIVPRLDSPRGSTSALAVAVLALLLTSGARTPAQEPTGQTSLIDRLIAASTDTDRNRLLDAQADSVTLDLYRQILARAKADADKPDSPKAVTEYDAAVSVALRLNAVREAGVGYRGLGLSQYR